MKLIKWIVIWMALAVLTLMGLARAVNEAFATHWANLVFASYLAMGLLFGISGCIRASSEKRKIRRAMDLMSSSADRQRAWASDLKERAAQVQTRCEENASAVGELSMLQPQYRAEEILAGLMDELAASAEIQSGLWAAVQTMEEEDGAA